MTNEQKQETLDRINLGGNETLEAGYMGAPKAGGITMCNKPMSVPPPKPTTNKDQKK